MTISHIKKLQKVIPVLFAPPLLMSFVTNQYWDSQNWFGSEHNLANPVMALNLQRKVLLHSNIQNQTTTNTLSFGLDPTFQAEKSHDQVLHFIHQPLELDHHIALATLQLVTNPQTLGQLFEPLYIKEWGLTSLQELRQLDKEAKAEVDQAIEEAKMSPAHHSKGLWTDIYDKGPLFMWGWECKEPLNNNMTTGGRKMSDPVGWHSNVLLFLTLDFKKNAKVPKLCKVIWNSKWCHLPPPAATNSDLTLDGANVFALHSPNLDLALMDNHSSGPNADYDIPEIGEGVEVFAPMTYAGHFCQGEHFEGAAIVYGIGDTFLRRFDMDCHAFHHQTNMYYPFANFRDWEMANFLLQSNLSMREVNNYLSLSMTKKMPLSFWTAKELHGHIEDLPKGPCWKVCIVPMRHLTTNPVQLYWHDSLKCIEALFNHPFYTGKMDYSPFCVFTAAERVMRVYSKWMSSDGAWDLQTKVPIGSMLCGIILSSDKTNITNICGGKVAHPLLISLANIRMNVWNKGSSHTFLLTTLMPIAKFIYPITRICSVLEAHLFHACLDFVLEPLKKAAQFGRMMADPLGNIRFRFTPLVSYIVDTPEVCMLACIRGKTSPVTKAMYKNFGNPFCHGPWTSEETLCQLESIPCDPNDVEAYFDACFLHWSVCIIGIACPGTTMSSGVTGAAHPDVIAVVHALTEFHYLAQAPAITEEGCEKIAAALTEFHHYKQAIIDGGLHQGDQSGSILEHWEIPKLELLQSIVPSISQVSSVLQWSVDMTEHTHIEVVKDPVSRMNNKDYSSQICCHLDRIEKCQMFNTAVHLHGTAEAGSSSSAIEHDRDQSDGEVDHAVDDMGEAEAAVLNNLWAPKQSPSDFFKIAAKLLVSMTLSSSPLRTFRNLLYLTFVAHWETTWLFTTTLVKGSNLLGEPDSQCKIYCCPLNIFKFGTKQLQEITLTASAYTIHAQLPNGHWKYGRYDAAILQVDEGHDWPDSSLTGHAVVEIHLIMRPCPPKGINVPWANRFLVYVWQFDVVNVEPSMHLHMLKQAVRTSGSYFSNVFPLDDQLLCSHCPLVW
ncbi:hypothetical protein BKA83DRAFT_4122566 [Pisolithus microcarpus]|nr:hypothetical protein BKA83DRAFT_4122566 [Pisolithus microcarpus]